LVDLNPLTKKEDLKETKKEGDILKGLSATKNYPNKLTELEK